MMADVARRRRIRELEIKGVAWFGRGQVSQSSHVFLLCLEPDLVDYVDRSMGSKEAAYAAPGSDLLTDPPRK